MKKNVLWVALLAAVALVCASTSFAGDFKVLKTSIVLPENGDTVAVKLRTFGPILVHEIWNDNTRTEAAGLCEVTNGPDGHPVRCESSAYALIRATINGSDWRPGQMPQCIAESDKLAIRMLFDQELSTDTAVPLGPSDELVLLFRTYHRDNDVKVDLTVGYTGGPGPVLLTAGPGPEFDPGCECCCGECDD